MTYQWSLYCKCGIVCRAVDLELELEAILVARAGASYVWEAEAGAGACYFWEAGAEAKYKISQWH